MRIAREKAKGLLGFGNGNLPNPELGWHWSELRVGAYWRPDVRRERTGSPLGSPATRRAPNFQTTEKT